MKNALCSLLLAALASTSFAQSPNITSDPLDAAVCAGFDTTFVVAATGNNLTYQWQVQMGGLFLNLSDDAFHNNVTGDTLFITNADALLNGLVYRCVVSGSVPPTDTSGSATLTVIEQPEVTSQPDYLVVCDGGNASFGVTAFGSNLMYQWQESTNAGASWSDLSNGGVYSNVGTGTLNLSGPGVGMSLNQYRCIVFNSCGADTSDAAALAIDQALTASAVLVANPSGTVCQDSITLTASVTNPAGYMGFLWRVNGAVIPHYDSVLVSDQFSDGDSVQVTVIVNNVCTGSDTIVTNTITLDLLDLTQIVDAPEDVAVCDGSGASFSVNALGDALSFQWQIDSNGTYVDLSDVGVYSGSTSSALNLASTTLAMDGHAFRVVVSGTCGADSTTAGVLTVEQNIAPGLSLAVSPVGPNCATPPAQPIIWTDLVNLSVTDGGTRIEKTGGANNAWDAGAASLQNFGEGGYVEWTVTDNVLGKYFAVSSANVGAGFDGQFGIYISTSGIVQIWEFVTSKGSFGTYSSGDQFRIAVEGGAVKYYRNGTNFYTSLTAPALPLIADIAVYRLDGGFEDAMILPYDNQLTFTASPSNALSNTTYQWQVNGQAVGSNDTLFSTSDLQSGDSVSVWMIYESACTGIDTVMMGMAPAIDPAVYISQDATDAVVCEGSAAWFAADVEGSSLSLQWQIDTSGTWQDLVANATYSDVTTDSMNIAATTSSMTGHRFRLVAEGDCDTIWSRTYELAVNSNNPTVNIGLVPAYPTCAEPSKAPVTWTNLVNASVGGTTVTKTGGGNAFNSGASSEQVVYDGGCLYYEANSDGFSRGIGLSESDADADLFTIGYAFYLTNTNKVFLYDHGTNMGQAGNYVVGDEFLISVANDSIRYYWNDAKVYASANIEQTGFVADISIFQNAGAVADVEVGNVPLFAPNYTGKPNDYSLEWYVNGSVESTEEVFSSVGIENGDTVQLRMLIPNSCSGQDTLTTGELYFVRLEEPEIISQPSDTAVCVFNSVSFGIGATGANLQYQWQVDSNGTWTNLSGGSLFQGVNTPTLNIPLAGGNMDGYEFRCQLTGTCGEAYSESALLEVDALLPNVVSITMDPAGSVCPDLLIEAPVVWTNEVDASATGSMLTKTGGTNDFDAGASGTYPVFNTGYVEYTLNNATDYRAVGISATDPDAGLSSMEYALYCTGTAKIFVYDHGVNVGQFGTYAPGDKFRLAVEDSMVVYYHNGVALYSSPAVTLPMYADASIVTPGASVDDAIIGRPPVFEASVTNAPGQLEYLWAVNGIAAGNDSPTLLTFDLNDGDSVSCTVVVNHLCTGTDSIASNVIEMDVLEGTQITAHPQSVSICEGTDTSFAVVATASNIAYQWQIDTNGTFIDIAADATFAGVNTAQLDVSAPTGALDGALLRCWVLGDCGDSLSTEAQMVVDEAVAATISITVDQTLPFCNPSTEGDTVTWTNLVNVSATGTAVTKTGTGPSFDASAISNELVFDGGSVAWTIDNETSYRAIGLSGSDTGSDLVDIEFGFYLPGIGELFIYESGINLGSFGFYSTGDELAIEVDGGVVSYLYNGTVIHTSTQTPSAVPMVVDISILSSGYTFDNVAVFNPPIFTASTNDLPSIYGYQWLLNGVAVGTDDPYYVTPNLADGDTVACLLISTNECLGTDTALSNEIVLDISTNTAILQQPDSLIICEGSDTTFSIVAEGANLMYQWQIDTNGTWVNLLADATFGDVDSATLSLSTTPLSLSGARFRCWANGDCGSKVSTAGLLTVDPSATPVVTISMDQSQPLCMPSSETVVATWTNLVGTDTTGGSLTKTNPQGAWNAGASTVQQVWDGGYFEITVENTTAYRMIGLTTSDDDQDDNDIEHAFYLAGNGQFFVYESGLNMGGFGAYSIGDVIRISVDGNNIRYYRNGTFLMASGGGNAPYVVDVTIYDQGGSVATPVLSNPPIFTATVANAPSSAAYQWLYNGIASGTNQATYSLPLLADGDSISVMLMYSNACIGSDTITASALGVQVIDNTAITAQPSDEVVCPGVSASFAANVEGDSLTFQWQVDSTGTFEDLADGGVYSGATDTLLMIASASANMDGNQYRLIVDGFCGSVISDTVLLSVDTLPPGITAQPMDVVACDATDAAFAVGAQGVGLAYQWQMSTDGGASFNDIVNGAAYSGATTDSLLALNVGDLDDGLQFRCIMTGDCWSGDTSAVAALSVLMPPTIVEQPADSTVCVGGASGFSVLAVGDGVTYQWRVSTNGGVSYNVITDGPLYSGTQTANLSIATVTQGMSGFLFSCLVSGDCLPQDGSDPALLAVYDNPTISIHPFDVDVCDGAPVSFSVVAAGDQVTFQWQESTDGGGMWTDMTNGANISGTSTATLSIAAASQTLEASLFRCVVSGPCSSLNSDAAGMSVSTLPVAQFSYTANGGLVAFTNESTNGFDPVWNYGDGSAPDTVANTHHVYASSGTYDVTLSVENQCGTADTTLSVMIDVTGLHNPVANATLSVYPNPASYVVNIAFSHNTAQLQSLRLEDMSGRVVRVVTVAGMGNQARESIDLFGMPAGSYLLKLETTEGTMVRKIVVR